MPGGCHKTGCSVFLVIIMLLLLPNVNNMRDNIFISFSVHLWNYSMWCFVHRASCEASPRPQWLAEAGAWGRAHPDWLQGGQDHHPGGKDAEAAHHLRLLQWMFIVQCVVTCCRSCCRLCNEISNKCQNCASAHLWLVCRWESLFSMHQVFPAWRFVLIEIYSTWWFYYLISEDS